MSLPLHQYLNYIQFNSAKNYSFLTLEQLRLWFQSSSENPHRHRKLAQSLLGLCLVCHFQEGIEFCLEKGACLNRLIPERFLNQYLIKSLPFSSAMNSYPRKSILRHPMTLIFLTGHIDLMPFLLEKGMNPHYQFNQNKAWDSLILYPPPYGNQTPILFDLFKKAKETGWIFNKMAPHYTTCYDIHQGTRPDILKALFEYDLFQDDAFKENFSNNTCRTLQQRPSFSTFEKESICLFYHYIPEIFQTLILNDSTQIIIAELIQQELEKKLPLSLIHSPSKSQRL